MPTQYIEDPETKEKIPFEWDKPTSPTSRDIDSLFKSVKGTKDLSARQLTPGTDIISTSPPKWAPWARTGIEMGGLVAGGLIGGIPGAGAGYAGAKQLAKSVIPRAPSRPLDKMDVEKELGMPLSDVEYQDFLAGGPQWEGLQKRLGVAPMTSIEKVIAKGGEVAREFGEGALMEATGRAVAPLIPRMLPFYARGRTPGAMEVAKIAEREGIKIPAADITGSTAQSAITSSVQKLPQSAYTMQKEAITATGQFADYVEKTLGKVGGKQEPFLAGQVAQEGRLIKLAEAKTQGGKFYTEAKDLLKGVDISHEATNKAIEDVTSSDAYQLLSEGSKKEVDKVISYLENKIRPDVSARTKVSLRLPMDVEAQVLKQAGQEFTPIPYAESEGMRKSIGNKLFSKNIEGTEAGGPIRYLYDALQDDMQVSAKMAGSKVHEKFVNARKFWSQNVFGEGVQKGVMGKIGEASPERAITYLKNASLDDIAKIRSGLPEPNFINFRQGLLTQIFQKNSQTSPITGEVIYNGSQIAKDLFGKSGLGEVKLKALMTAKELSFLKEMATVGERMGASWRIAGNPSGTAHTLYVLHLLGQVGSAVGAGLAGEVARKSKGTGAGLATAGAFLSPYIVAKLITSNAGRKYLIGGFPMAEKVVGRSIPGVIAGTRGMLSKPEPQITLPPMGGGPNFDKELANSRQAIAQGAPADKVKAMFKVRTGKEYPE